jgi:hypothetical protein
MAHANARLTEFGRLLLVQRITELGWPPAMAAEALGVSRATAYKWLGRYRQHGQADVKKLGRIPDGGGHRAHGRSTTTPTGRGIGYDYLHSAVTTAPGSPSARSSPMSRPPPQRCS